MADKLISATTSGDDLIFKVNVSGTPTEAMRILGTDGSVSGNITPSGITTETNMLTSASSTASGWTGTNATVTTTTTTGDLPLNGVVSTAIQIASSTLNGYAEVPFSIPEGLKNTKLKVEFYQRPAAGYVSGDFKVEVWNSGLTTEYSLSTDSSGTSGLPSMTGKYTTTFDTDTNTSYKLVVKRTVASAATINLSKVVIGPGIQPQGAVVEGWKSYTPTVSNLGAGSTSTLKGNYRRVGDSLQVFIQMIKDATPGSGAGNVTFSLPSGLTVDTSKIPSVGGGSNVGFAVTYGIVASAQFDRQAQVYPETSTAVAVLKPSTASAYKGADFAASTEIQMQFTVPIAEWSGSGTVNLAQNDVEYAYNSSTSTTDDTTTFGYGPAGALIKDFAPSGTNVVVKGIQFQTAIQQSDFLEVEVDNGIGKWQKLSERIQGYSDNDAGTTSYGYRLQITGTNTASVLFYSKAAVGTTWANINTWRWRVRKTSAGAAVGFGIVQPGVSAGLVSASGVPGNTTGNPIAAGYVGEVLTATLSDVTLTNIGQDYVSGSLVLTAGTWLVSAHIRFTLAGTTMTACDSSISLNTATDLTYAGRDLSTGVVNTRLVVPPIRVINTTGQTIYLVSNCSFTGSAPTTSAAYSFFKAVRIA